MFTSPTIITQPPENGTPQAYVELKQDEDGDLRLEINEDADAASNEARALVWLNTHNARRLYNAIGDAMGFSKPVPLRSAPKGKQAYKGNGNHKWELVTADDKGAGHTYRIRVPGGWLYRTVSYVDNLGSATDGDIAAQSTVFVPVPDVVGYDI